MSGSVTAGPGTTSRSTTTPRSPRSRSRPNTDYDSGTAIVESLPGAAAGAPVQLTLVPANGVIKLVNTATTGAAGSANTLSIERDHGTNIVRVTGSVPLGASVGQEWVTVWEPELYAADVFRRALAAQGIQVGGRIANAATPATARSSPGTSR